MYLDSNDIHTELFRRTSIFGRLPPATRLRILGVAARNDLRGVVESTPAQRQVLASLGDAATESADLHGRVTEIVARLVDARTVAEQAQLLHDANQSHTWWARLPSVANWVYGTVTEPWSRMFVLSSVLALAGHIPLTGFAFGRWHLPTYPVTQEWADLIELATCYLYRLVPTTVLLGVRNEVGRGAYCIVERHGDIAVKTPLNLAAPAFMLRQEALLLQELSRTPAGHFLPRLGAFDEKVPRLSRQFIAGPTGHDVLQSGGLTPLQTSELRRAYDGLSGALGDGCQTLDLHPSNFVWHENELRWVLVDAGPVPRIGFDYYDLDSFDSYLRDVWSRRLERMQDEPIRSIDLAFHG